MPGTTADPGERMMMATVMVGVVAISAPVGKAGLLPGRPGKAPQDWACWPEELEPPPGEGFSSLGTVKVERRMF